MNSQGKPITAAAQSMDVGSGDIAELFIELMQKTSTRDGMAEIEQRLRDFVDGVVGEFSDEVADVEDE